MTAARSLLIKIALLLGTTGLVLWIGWPVPGLVETRPPAGLPEAETASRHTPAPGDPAGSPRPASAVPAPIQGDARLDLNRAQAGELETLPGIGPRLARRIVAHRQQVGRFHSVEDLGRVKGIGSKRLERLRPLVRVVGSQVTGSGPHRRGPDKGTPGG